MYYQAQNSKHSMYYQAQNSTHLLCIWKKNDMPAAISSR